MTPVKGQWVDFRNNTISERMIPVRIVATEEQILKIVDFTLTYYEQDAILAYKIGTDVILRSKNA